MKHLFQIIVAIGLVAGSTAHAAPLEITLASDPRNPPRPVIGEQLSFRSTITNTGDAPIEGLVSWISVVQVDPGQERAVELKDWNADKTVTRAVLMPGEQVSIDWPLHPIEPGDYRIIVSTASRAPTVIATAPLMAFHADNKLIIDSQRVIAIAVGLPLALVGLMAWRLRGRRRLARIGNTRASVAEHFDRL